MPGINPELINMEYDDEEEEDLTPAEKEEIMTEEVEQEIVPMKLLRRNK